ncbi:MAG: GAF domain-containing sensor histidine kinase [PVC group bacterium]|nr:GAF domain-containing sensor histidine kinase [PVC group bacterium]
MINYKATIDTLYKINKFLGYIDDLNRLLTLIMQEASKAVTAEASSIAIYDQDEKNLKFTVALGEKGEQIKTIKIELGQGVIGAAARDMKPVNIADVTKHENLNANIDKKTGFKTKSVLAVPIMHNWKLIGALEVINKKNADYFSRQDEELLEIIAGQAAIAIENAKLYQRLDKKHQALLKKHKQLIEAQEKMITMERLSAIGKMASYLVHDFKGPLTGVRGYAQLLDSKVSGEDKKNFIQIIIDSVDKLVGMINELLEFARGEPKLDFSECMLGDFIHDTCKIIEKDLQDNKIKLVKQLDYCGPVCIDKDKMRRVIINLCSNAKEVLSKGGIIKIETECYYEKITIKVSDDGPGVPDKIRKNLFEPFVTEGKSTGTGLGLAIVKKIVESHKGSIYLNCSSPDDSFSTIFTIQLPEKDSQ